jgi:hypothetical protein
MASADALSRLVAAVSAADSGAVEAFCARVRRRRFVFGVTDRETKGPNDHDVSGTAPPSRMTRVQRSQIAAIISSMAALIFKHTCRLCRTILPAV